MILFAGTILFGWGFSHDLDPNPGDPAPPVSAPDEALAREVATRVYPGRDEASWGDEL